MPSGRSRSQRRWNRQTVSCAGDHLNTEPLLRAASRYLADLWFGAMLRGGTRPTVAPVGKLLRV